MKISNRIQVRFEQTEEKKISELEDRTIEMTNSQIPKEKRIKKSEQRVRGLQDTSKSTNICTVRVSKGEERERMNRD